jgi:glycosyltransferase involved in cell wall biosynthesis
MEGTNQRPQTNQKAIMAAKLVTAVMLTGHCAARRPLAAVSIEAFCQQTYPHRELLILNQSDVPIAPGVDNIREVFIAEQPIGTLRNRGLEIAQGDYIITWDDDDWSGPRRIEEQLQWCPDGGCCILDSYVTLKLPGYASFIHSCRGYKLGCCVGTILHARTDFRYPDIARGEDSAFATHFQRANKLRKIANNPLMYVRSWHAYNASVTRKLRGRETSRRNLSTAQLQELQPAIQLYKKAAEA